MPRPEDPQSFNRYAYARNSPLVRVDPSGHLDIPWDKIREAVEQAAGDCLQRVSSCLGAPPLALPSIYAMAALTTNVAEATSEAQAGALMAKGQAKDDEKDKRSSGQGGSASGPGGGSKNKKQPETVVEGEFSLTNDAFENYPQGRVPKPKGPFRILEGEEYVRARARADAANSRLHAADPALKGKQIHEIHPVKFGGNPTDPANKVALSPSEHQRYTIFWRRLLQLLKPRHDQP